MSPLRVDITDGSGEEFPGNGISEMEALGRVMAELGLQALMRLLRCQIHYPSQNILLMLLSRISCSS